MRIVSVDMPPSPELNLGAIKMDKLGATVIIAGRNGAGKSRLLKQLINWSANAADKKAILQRISAYESALANPAQPNRDHLETQLNLFRQNLALSDTVKTNDPSKPVIVSFVPNKLEISDPNKMARSNLLTAAKSVETPGVAHLPNGSFALIQLLQDREREATHPQQSLKKEDSEKAIAEYAQLKTLVRQFLNTTITRSINSEAELFDLPLGRTALSDGQKVLLQLCIAIHAQGANLNDLIIFMDEPENHLHPGALLDLVGTVQKRLKNGQLWIATHSIPLLAEIDTSSIWWMEDHSISKAGGKPEKVLEGLLGNSERRERLASFLDLPFVFASNRFAAECLLPPGTVAHVPDDPQTRQIRTALEKLCENSSTLRLLDFGAGKGRLASELAEVWTPEQRAKIDYIAFDSSSKDSEECKAAIARLGGNGDPRIFHNATSLRARYDEASFDVVVMCNVLHEIIPSGWGQLFGPEGQLTKMLKPSGFLLLVEVQQLPYGEHAHQNGFLVLDTAQLRKLFKISETDLPGFKIDEAKDGWLKAHLIAQPLLARYSVSTREAALKDLSSTASDRIRELREQPANYRNGRLHGFWVQQFANSQLALSS